MALNPTSFKVPLGAITIDSALEPDEVIENLRARGREWRGSSISEELRKFNAGALFVEVEGRQFQMRWMGNVSRFYNPACFGIVQPYGEGSRIKAGFKLNPKDFAFVGCMAAMAFIALLGKHDPISWILIATLTVLVIAMLLTNRSGEPMRARLIEVLADAAGQTNRPRVSTLS